MADSWSKLDGSRSPFSELGHEFFEDIFLCLETRHQSRLRRISRFWQRVLSAPAIRNRVYIRLPSESCHHRSVTALQPSILKQEAALVAPCLHADVTQLILERGTAVIVHGHSCGGRCDRFYEPRSEADDFEKLMKETVAPRSPHLQELTVLDRRCGSSLIGQLYGVFPVLSQVNLIRCRGHITWPMTWCFYSRDVQCASVRLSGRCLKNVENQLVGMVDKSAWTSMGATDISDFLHFMENLDESPANLGGYLNPDEDTLMGDLRGCLFHWEPAFAKFTSASDIDLQSVDWNALRDVTQEIVTAAVELRIEQENEPDEDYSMYYS